MKIQYTPVTFEVGFFSFMTLCMCVCMCVCVFACVYACVSVRLSVRPFLSLPLPSVFCSLFIDRKYPK